MAYTCDLGSGQRIYLNNTGADTIITLASSSTGQQQQASSRFQVGAWTQPPELYRRGANVFIKLSTSQGDHYLQLQGNQMGALGAAPDLSNCQQMGMQQAAAPATPSIPDMEPMQPMQPMQPMTMGDMQMSTQPMQMRMGNMAMSMGESGQNRPANADANTGGRRFCTQCGQPVSPSDRFCGQCGHQL